MFPAFPELSGVTGSSESIPIPCTRRCSGLIWLLLVFSPVTGFLGHLTHGFWSARPWQGRGAAAARNRLFPPGWPPASLGMAPGQPGQLLPLPGHCPCPAARTLPLRPHSSPTIPTVSAFAFPPGNRFLLNPAQQSLARPLSGELGTGSAGSPPPRDGDRVGRTRGHSWPPPPPPASFQGKPRSGQRWE